jgi:hypothetical protein
MDFEAKKSGRSSPSSFNDFPMKEQSASNVKNERFKLNLEEDSDSEDYAELLQRQHGKMRDEPVDTESETEETKGAEEAEETERRHG